MKYDIFVYKSHRWPWTWRQVRGREVIPNTPVASPMIIVPPDQYTICLNAQISVMYRITTLGPKHITPKNRESA